MDGPVDLVGKVGGGGGGSGRICKKKICRAPKGHKKNCTGNIVKKKISKQNIKVLALYMFIIKLKLLL